MSTPIQWNSSFSVHRGFKQPDAVEEDPEASEAAFEQGDITPLIPEYDPYNVGGQLERAEALVAMYEGLESNRHYVSHIMRSYKHVTLPEFLIYIYLKDNPGALIEEIGFALDETSVPGKDIEGELCFFGPKKQKVASYVLRYMYQELAIEILENKKPVGWVRYIIRGRKIEEIEGRFRGKNVVLDPVWSTRSKGQLKEEYLRYGSWRVALMYRANIKHASASTLYPGQQMSMKHGSVSADRHVVWVTKSVACEEFRLETALVFHRHILMPISGKWTVSRVD